MKRTRRIEVFRYSRRTDVRPDSPIPDIGELLAIARIHESTCEGDEPATLEPLPVQEPRQTLRSRARRLLRGLKTK